MEFGGFRWVLEGSVALEATDGATWVKNWIYQPILFQKGCSLYFLGLESIFTRVRVEKDLPVPLGIERSNLDILGVNAQKALSPKLLPEEDICVCNHVTLLSTQGFQIPI